MKISQAKVQKVGTALRNPTVQKVLAWLLPIVLGWALSKFDKAADASSKKSKK